MIDIIATLMFYLTPILIGGVLRLNRKKSEAGDKIEILIEDTGLNFIVGSLAIFSTALLCNYIYPSKFSEIFKGIIYTATFLAICLLFYRNYKHKTQLVLKEWTTVGIVLTIVINVIIYFIWRLDSPINTTLNWDLYHQQNIITSIINNKFNFLPNNLSDSFGFTSYTTLFHTLGATPFLLFKRPVLEFWYYIEFFHLVSTSFVMYFVLKVFTRNKGIALIGALISPMFFESLGAYTTFFWIPQNVTATIAAFSIAKLVKDKDMEGKIHYLDTALAIIFLILMHYIIGALGVALMLISYIFLYAYKSNKHLGNILLYIGLVLMVILPGIAKNIDLNSLNQGEAASFNYSFYEKGTFLLDVYGITPLLLALLAVFSITKDKSVHNNELKTLLLLNIIFITILTTPLPYVLKLFSIGRYFFIALFMYGLRILVKNFNNSITILIIGTLSISTFIVFIINITKYKQAPSYKDTYTHISPYEVEAAKFIARNYNQETTMLISDPSTMQILEGVSGINSPGGAFTKEATRAILSNTYLTRDIEASTQFNNIQDGIQSENYHTRLLVISGRYAQWQSLGEKEKMGIVENIWKPKDLSYTDWKEGSYLRYLEDTSNFKEVYKNQGLVIFEIPNKIE